MNNTQAPNRTLALRFNNELKLENPEDFDLTPEQAKCLELQLSSLIERTKTGLSLPVARKIQ